MTRTLKWVVCVIAATTLSLSAASSQTPLIHRVMREKLDRSQKIFEAVVTSDWAGLERQTGELARLVETPAWAVLNSPEYSRQSAAFLRAVEELSAAAKEHDGEAAPLAYVSMAMGCVHCHRYIARARMTR